MMKYHTWYDDIEYIILPLDVMMSPLYLQLDQTHDLKTSGVDSPAAVN